MSDYTPTTVEVRFEYMSFPDKTIERNPNLQAAKEFDRWLDQHDAIIAKATEERIIKLLETDSGQRIMCLDCSEELITLIKGENEINNKIILTPEEFDGLEKSLTEPAKPNENLNKLLKGNK